MRRTWTRAAALGVVAAVTIAASACTAAAGPGGADAGTLVGTDLGQVRGVADGGVVRFHGVPYAQPPVGDLRWAPPAPARPWPGVRSADRATPPCPQPAGVFAAAQTDEDCLYLDVTAPEAAPAAGTTRPVLVWVSDSGGTGAGTLADARRMALRGDAVVVTVNSRLGVFGQLALPGMTDPAQFTLADQQEALRFVRRNAAAFGGDPRNVTLFGESGGGIWTCAQLASPTARGLFDKAIVMSAVGMCGDPQAPDFPGPGVLPTPRYPFAPLRETQQQSTAIIAKLGCTDPRTALDCARRLPASALVTVPPISAGAATAPGTLLPRSPMQAITSGEFNRVPVLSGGTRDEAYFILTSIQAAGLPPLTEQTYTAAVHGAYPDLADQVLARYPARNYPTPDAAWVALSSDRSWACPAAVLNDTLAAHTPVYGYEFADRSAPLLGATPVPTLPTPGAGHGSDVGYLLDDAHPSSPGLPDTTPGQTTALTPPQSALADTMITTWTTFARTATAPIPPWSPQQHTAIAFGDPTAPHTSTPDLWQRHHCEFWADDITADIRH